MTHAQKGIWLSQQLLGLEVTASNMGYVSYWNLALDESAFCAAFARLIQECDAMRMLVPPNQPDLKIGLVERIDFELPVVDAPPELMAMDRKERYDYFSELCGKPLDFSQRLFDAKLYRIGNKQYALWWVQHHLITDGRGFPVQQQRLWEIYQDQVGPAVSLAIPAEHGTYASLTSFADYLSDFQKRFGAISENTLQYWNAIQKRIPEAPQFYGRANLQSVTASSARQLVLDQEICDRIRLVLQEKELRSFSFDLSLLTLFTSLTLAFAYRVSGQRQQSIGLPFHNRQTLEDQNVAGIVMEIFPLVTEVSQDETFASFYQKVRNEIMATMRHAKPNTSPQECSRKIVSYFNLAPQSMDPSGRGVIKNDWLDPGHGEPNYHLAVKLFDFDGEGRWTLRIDLNHEIFPADLRPLILPQFIELLEAFLDKRNQPIDLVTEATLKRVKAFQRSFLPDTNSRTIVEAIQRYARETPNQLALKFQDRTHSFSALDHRSNQLARLLTSEGIGKGDIIGVCTERSDRQVILLLGIMKAGAAYVPLDPEHPTERLDFLLRDSGAKGLVYGDRLSDRFTNVAGLMISEAEIFERSASLPTDAPVTLPAATDLIYIYYTSGSTGHPKGVLVQHDGVLNLLQWMGRVFALGPGQSSLLYKTILGFDTAPWEIFSPLVNGGYCLVAEPGKGTDVAYLEDIASQENTTVGYFVAPLLQDYIANGGQLPVVRQLMSGGDELKPAIVREVFKRYPNAKFYNIYGPTEGSITATLYPFKREEMMSIREIPIGYPVDNVTLIVCAPDGKLVPVGVPGELYVGGIQVARGYHNRPELTAEKFIERSPFPGTAKMRFYRTGDLVRWRADGALIFLGRIDNQVKIRGVRLEPDGIEKVLRQAPGVDSALIQVVSSAKGEKALAAYVKIDPKTPYDTDTVRSYLADRLPTVMQPSYLIDLTEFPLLPNGKIDRKSLPAPGWSSSQSLRIVAPRNEFEDLVFNVWRAFFPDQDFGVLHSFFDLNGQSLIAIRIVNRINEDLELNLAANSVFRFPTIAKLAAFIEETIRNILAEMEEAD